MRCVLIERGSDWPAPQGRGELMRDGSLDPESNMNFGEGGAGAYTDGKLSTRINHPHGAQGHRDLRAATARRTTS